MRGRAFIPIVVLAAIIGCSKEQPAANPTQAVAGDTTGKVAATPETKELKIEDLVPGTGKGAEDGDTLTMLYRGTLTNGVVFDGNMDDKQKADLEKPPLAVPLGMGQVIKGWDQGLKGVKVGGVRKLTIPPSLGYGAMAQGDKIPPNAELVFTVKCLDIVRKGEEKIIDTNEIKVGTGPEAKSGDFVSVHYVGKLLNGKQFDSSRVPGGKPFEFQLGAGRVVPGFDKGIQGMKVGGTRFLRIPPMAAYGADPQGGIPPNSVLTFEIELMKISKTQTQPDPKPGP